MSAYKNEKAFYADGQHEPIISEALFYEVQDCLNGNKKTYRTTLGSQEIFQLRGFLICPKCNKLLTGSASKGRNGKYYYYHCSSKCGVRFKSENANELFVKELKKYVPAHKMINIYSQVINSAYLTRSKGHRAGIQSLKLEVDNVNKKLAKARDLLLASALDAVEYKEIKAQCEKQIQVLEVKMVEASSKSVMNLEMLLHKGIQTLTELDVLYTNADTKKKRQIIGSIFPEKLAFDGFQYRTARLNSVASLIFKLGEGFSEKKIGEIDEKINFSYLVDP